MNQAMQIHTSSRGNFEMSKRNRFEFIKEHLKKGNRLMVLYPPTKFTHEEIHWDIMLLREDCYNPECSMRVSREYIDGEFKNQFCEVNTWRLYTGEINIDVYIITEEF